MKNLSIKIKWILFSGVITSLITLWSIWSIFIPTYRLNSQSIHMEIPLGSSKNFIISQLKKQKLIYSYFPYEILYRWTLLQAGEYLLNTKMSPYHIFRTISQGKVITYDITIPEGTNMFEIANLLDEKNLITKQEFLSICQNSQFIKEVLGESIDSLEGYLYPNTYQLTKGLSAKAIVLKMVKEFLKTYRGLSSSQTSLSRHQVVILASIVEKETGVEWERPRIASVFYNRLKKGMKFQSDPTILYGMLRQTGQMPFNIRKKDILAPTPYNTYTLPSFPKGPIANPGRKALEAVLNPENTNYYYFVSKNDGSHVFSTNLKDHNNAVNLYQRRRKPKKN